VNHDDDDKKAPFMKIYTQYCSNYDNSIAIIKEHKTSNVAFANFLTVCSFLSYKLHYMLMMVVMMMCRVIVILIIITI
jgi:uncharacterized membrane protein YbaN (DUF454 family)